MHEREVYYGLLSQTTQENINKNFNGYSIDPTTRYLNVCLDLKRKNFGFDQIKHLYEVKQTDNYLKRKLNSPLRLSNIQNEQHTATMINPNLKHYLKRVTQKENDRVKGFFLSDTIKRNVRAQSIYNLNFGSSIESSCGVIGGADVCHLCEKKVYLMEREFVLSLLLHKNCFRCNYCTRILRHGNYGYTKNSKSLKCKIANE